MEAFNIPYCGFNPNNSIQPYTFASTATFSFASSGSESHTVTHDICMIHINSFCYFNSNLAFYRDMCITSLKNSDFASINFGYPTLTISKTGALIKLNSGNTSGANSTVIVIYEFDFI